MSTTQHTSHYNLPTFGDNPNDRPSWRGDFTEAMTTIDNQMYANATNIVTATATANNANTAAGEARTSADNALSLARTNEGDIADLESYFNALGVTSVQTAQNFNDKVDGKAEASAVTSLQKTVSDLSDTVSTKANGSDVYTRSASDARYTQQGGYGGTAQQIHENIVLLGNWVNSWLSGWQPLQVTFGQSNVNNSLQVMYNSTLKMLKINGRLEAATADNGQQATFTIPGYTADKIMQVPAIGFAMYQDSSTSTNQKIGQTQLVGLEVRTDGSCVVDVPKNSVWSGPLRAYIMQPLVILDDWSTSVIPES